MQRTILITGAAQGIGLAIATYLATQNYQVIGIDLHESKTKFPGTLFLADLSSTELTEKCLQEITQQYHIDAIVNNVALSIAKKITAVDLAEHQRLMDINLKSTIQLAKFLVPGMEKNHWGRIINIGSIRAFGGKDTTSYSASKAAMIGVTKAWALELADFGITANCVAPGAVDTELLRRDYPPGSAAEQELLALLPIKRFAKSEEIAATVAFLISENASYITGQVIVIDGGATLVRI